MAKTKQQAADEAYRNAEAQRALVIVLAAAEGTERVIEREQVPAACALVRAHFLTVSEPPKVKTLAGQIDLVDGSVEGAPAVFEDFGAHLHGVPDVCPDCGADMHSVYGGSWTPVLGAPGQHNVTPGLQCGHCAFIVPVSKASWEAVRAERRATIGAADRAPEKVDRGGKKTRGAE